LSEGEDKMSMNNKNQRTKSKFSSTLLRVALVIGVMGVAGLANSETVHGHGYVQDPPSRAFQGRLKFLTGRWTWNQVNEKYGAAVNEPQSIEAKGSYQATGNNAFPINGPADEQLASGGLGIFEPLDVQRENYWDLTDINPGLNEFTWYITAGHATKDFEYYITKPDWDPNTPLTRKDLEKIATIPYQNNHNPGRGEETHQVNIPNDRSGYHVIYAIWDIGDTDYAFYQAIDVNITNDQVEERPTPPQPDPDLECHHNDVVEKIMWVTRQDDNQDLTHESAIEVPLDFVDRHGRSEINLLLTGADNRPLDLTDYEVIFSNQGVLGNTRTTVEWQQRGHIHLPILAVGETTVSIRHKETNQVEGLLTIIVTTDDEKEEKPVTPPEQPVHPTAPAFDATTVYTGGEIVYFEGNLYEAKWWTLGGNPATSDAWEIIVTRYEDGSTDFRLSATYFGGDLVRFEGNLYRAKWWIRGELPNNSQAWEFVGPVRD
jgi:chitin-binding protein